MTPSPQTPQVEATAERIVLPSGIVVTTGTNHEGVKVYQAGHVLWLRETDARAFAAALASASKPEGEIDDAWQDLVEKTDRTSPEDYPEMALITKDELAGYMRSAALEAARAVAVPEGLVRPDWHGKPYDKNEPSIFWNSRLGRWQNKKPEPLSPPPAATDRPGRETGR